MTTGSARSDGSIRTTPTPPTPASNAPEGSPASVVTGPPSSATTETPASPPAPSRRTRQPLLTRTDPSAWGRTSVGSATSPPASGLSSSSALLGRSGPSRGGMLTRDSRECPGRRNSWMTWAQWGVLTIVVSPCSVHGGVGQPAVVGVGGGGAGRLSAVAADGGGRQRDPADAVVLQAADVEVPVELPHRRDAGVVVAARVPQGFEHLASVGHLEDAAVVHARVEPFVAGDLLEHAAPEGRHPVGEIEGRGAHAGEGDPVRPVRRPVDVVGVAGEVVDEDLDLARLRAAVPVAQDPAQPGLGDEQRLPVVGAAHAVGEDEARQDRARLAGGGVVADNQTVG